MEASNTPTPSTPHSEAVSPNLYHILCDESRQTADRFMVLGGAIVVGGNQADIDTKVSEFRRAESMTAEMKWTRVNRQKLDKYKRFLDIFFELLECGELAFHSMILDTHEIDHKRFNQGDKELGFYKFFYQLLLHSFGKRYCRKGVDDRFIVHLDHRTSSYPLSTLKDVLNNGMKKKCGIASAPFRNVQPIDSRNSNTLQFVDLILGAIGYQKNGYHALPGSSAAKGELMRHILTKSKLTTLTNGTPLSRKTFTIWVFRLQKSGAPSA